MSLRALVLLACAALVLGAPQQSDSTCTDFCEDPVLGLGHYVCCYHEGKCPSRQFCPHHIGAKVGPTICEFDYQCSKTEKCCYDVCLKHKTCKRVV
uniref:PET15 n=1 Tax=Panulirus argus TaxID=6737 RepID=Q7YW82_PANAR|nr:PET15 [Panulirus argus]